MDVVRQFRIHLMSIAGISWHSHGRALRRTLISEFGIT